MARKEVGPDHMTGSERLRLAMTKISDLERSLRVSQEAARVAQLKAEAAEAVARQAWKHVYVVPRRDDQTAG